MSLVWLGNALAFPRLARGGGARGMSGHLCCPHNRDPDKQQKMDGWMNSRSFHQKSIRASHLNSSEIDDFFPIVTRILKEDLCSLLFPTSSENHCISSTEISSNIFLRFIHKACSLNKERSLSNMSKLSYRTCKEHYFTAISCTLEKYFGNKMYVRSRTCFNHPITQFTPFQVFSIFLNFFFHS